MARRPGEVGGEEAHIVRRRAAPAVDRLPDIADHPQAAPVAGQFAQEQAAGAIHVLILVDEDMGVGAAYLVAKRRVPPQEFDRAGDQVAEVELAFAPQVRLVVAIHRRDLEGLLGRDHRLIRRRPRPHRRRQFGVRGGVDRLVLGARDGPQDVAQADRRLVEVAVVIERQGGQVAFQDEEGVDRVDDRRPRGQPDARTMLAEQLQAIGVERADPDARGLRRCDQRDALAHLLRRLIGEGQGQDRLGRGAAREQVGDARRQSAGLPGPWAGLDQHRATRGMGRLLLARIEGGHLVRRPRRGGGGTMVGDGRWHDRGDERAGDLVLHQPVRHANPCRDLRRRQTRLDEPVAQAIARQ